MERTPSVENKNDHHDDNFDKLQRCAKVEKAKELMPRRQICIPFLEGIHDYGL